MAVATTFRILWPPQAGIDGTGADRLTSGTSENPIPLIMYGNGTPAGTLAPWTTAAKGSIWLSRDQTANTAPHAFIKVQANDANADWVPFDEIGGLKRYETMVFDMDAAANEYDYWYCPRAITIRNAYLVYVEATDASAAAEAAISAGTAADGTQVIGATAIAVSKAVGDVTALTIVSGVIAAAGKVVTKNLKTAGTEAGKYKVVYLYSEQ